MLFGVTSMTQSVSSRRYWADLFLRLLKYLRSIFFAIGLTRAFSRISLALPVPMTPRMSGEFTPTSMQKETLGFCLMFLAFAVYRCNAQYLLGPRKVLI